MQPIVVGENLSPSRWQRLKYFLWPHSLAGRIAVVTVMCLVIGGFTIAFFIMRNVQNSPTTGTSQPNQSGQSSSPSTNGQLGTQQSESADSAPTSGPNNTGATNGTNNTAQSGGNSNSSGNSGSGGSDNSGGNGGGSPASCGAFPLFPDASCTGYAYTDVTLHECGTDLTVDNATYDSCNFDGGIVVQAENVTITRSRIQGIVSPLHYGPYTDSLRNLSLTDVEIDGSKYPDPYGQAAIGPDDYTCTRCNVHNTGRGANFRFNVRIQDSYFHDFAYVDGAHQSGIGSNGGNNNQIIHNNIVCNGVGGSGCSGALVMYGDFDPIDNILVQNNLFNTDGSYCTYAGSTGDSSGKPYPHGTNIRFLDNRWGKKYYSGCGVYGPVAAWEYNTGNIWSGNAWQDGSGAITP